MKNTYPSYYKKFVCVADKCPDTCCAGWQIVVDPESAEKYRCADGEIGKKLCRSMAVDADGDTVFVSQNRRCPFLLESNLCEIYIELGKDSLCKTCTLFPRHVTHLGARKETGLSISCPEAARLIFESAEPISFETSEDNTPPEPNSIDPTLYFTLAKAQKTAINILQNRNFSVTQRLIAFIRFCDEIQQKNKAKDFSQTPVTEDFYEPAKFNPTKAKNTMNKCLETLEHLEKLDNQWNTELRSAKKNAPEKATDFSAFLAQNEWETEHLAVYFAYRYFMTAAFDCKLNEKARFTVFSVIACLVLQAALPDYLQKTERIEAARRYSKEVEHSAENMESVTLAIKKSRCFGSDNLINILSR